MVVRKNKKITLDKLALIIGKEFNRTSRLFDKLEGRFDKLEGRFDKLEKKVDKGFAENKNEHQRISFRLRNLERRVICVEDILTDHDKILRIHGRDLAEIKEGIRAIKKQGTGRSQRISRLEERVAYLEAKILS